ncbi:MAG: glycosyltransferase family 2 protein, partial [Deltaproteobacteria bacterium]|nr:glycosyltransferase family 2 protein [Deltaproteobacteria bacterium]
ENLGVKVILDNKKGKGEALRHVVNFVNGNIIVFIDADGSHDPKDIPKLVEPIIKDEADHVSGSRLIGGSSELHGGFDECFRLMGSSFITACINWRFKVKLSESQNGFRAIKTDIIKQLGLEENITTIEQEMIMKTLKNGFRMAEVPSHEYERKKGYSKISLKKVWFRYVYTLVKYLFF